MDDSRDEPREEGREEGHEEGVELPSRVSKMLRWCGNKDDDDDALSLAPYS